MNTTSAYQALVDMTVNSENVRWNRFYNYLTANSLFILAWAMIYQSTPAIVPAVALCLFGIAGGPVWAAMGHRASRFQDKYLRLGSHLERKACSEGKPFTISLSCRDASGLNRIGTSYYVLILAPLALSCLYTLLLEVTLSIPLPGQLLTAFILLGMLGLATIITVVCRQKNPQAPRPTTCRSCGGSVYLENVPCQTSDPESKPSGTQ